MVGSDAEAEHLAKAGIPAECVHVVPNGMNIDAFTDRLRVAGLDAFAAVACRNRLPNGP